MFLHKRDCILSAEDAQNNKGDILSHLCISATVDGNLNTEKAMTIAKRKHRQICFKATQGLLNQDIIPPWSWIQSNLQTVDVSKSGSLKETGNYKEYYTSKKRLGISERFNMERGFGDLGDKQNKDKAKNHTPRRGRQRSKITKGAKLPQVTKRDGKRWEII